MKTEIVAELSCNHNGNLDDMLRLIEACSQAGADAVKIQVWSPWKMTVYPHTIQSGAWAGKDLAELYLKAWTPWSWHYDIFVTAQKLGIEVIPSVFDIESLAIMEAIGVKRYKIASYELIDIPLLRAVAKTGKPVILSTGMASNEEINIAVDELASNELTLLRCVSAYPSKPEDAGLYSMAEYGVKYDCRYGISDHSTGIGVAVAASVLGASIIEKHVTLDKSIGLDRKFSILPDELKLMVDTVHDARSACKFAGVAKEETELRRSLYWAKDLPEGHVIEESDLITARPALGISPLRYDALIGKKLVSGKKRNNPVLENEWR